MERKAKETNLEKVENRSNGVDGGGDVHNVGANREPRGRTSNHLL